MIWHNKPQIHQNYLRLEPNPSADEDHEIKLKDLEKLVTEQVMCEPFRKQKEDTDLYSPLE